MGQIVAILNFEEGYRELPYLDTQGFPTVAGGIRIGPKGASLSNYTFNVPRSVGDAWKLVLITQKLAQMKTIAAISAALGQCNDARTDVLISMAYQMGVGNPAQGTGLAGFTTTLGLITQQNFSAAADNMLKSLWAKQTPARAQRHAEVMRTGTYDAYKGLI